MTLPVTCLRMLAIELTNICDKKCLICWSQTPVLNPPRPKGFMSTKLFTHIMTDLKTNYFPKHVIVGLNYGGESMLHPHWEQFSRIASDMDFRHLQIATNGSKLNKHNNDVLLDCYTQIAISLHNDLYLWKTIRHLKLLWHQRERRGKLPHIRANIVSEEFSQQELDMIKLKLAREVDEIKVVNSISEDLKTPVPMESSFEFCPNLFMYMGILWNGDTLPCCHILSPGRWSLGNVAGRTLKSVFNGKPYQRLRIGSFEGTPCVHCQIRSF